MWITDSAIRRPLTIMMLVLGLMILGFQSMQKMPVDLMPKVDIPYVSIITVYRGAGPNELETLISKKIEEQVASINKVKNVTSNSQEGVSVVVVEFQIGVSLDTAASDIRDRLDRIKGDLPDDADDPILYKLDLNAQPIMYLGMSGKRTPAEIKKLADDVVKDRLGKVDGVASVSVTGGDTRELFVKVDQERLKANSVNIMEITQAIAQANLNIPAGSIKQGKKEYTVRIVGEFTDPQELQDMRIKRSNPQIPGVVELKDLATVLDTSAERSQFTRLDRKDSVGLVIQKQADANTVQVAEGSKKEIEKLKKELPPDVVISISRDNSLFIKDSLNDVTKNLYEAAILATLVVFLFLHVFRATFIILLAIPTSILATFLPIYFFGFSLNSITLMGLALCVGILVDDSIVVLENIFRHLSLGESPRDAALKGRMEIGGAAIAITMTDVVVYLPIAFMGGIVGMFFRQFGITVATATLFSLFMSFTLTPMLASRWLKASDAHIVEEAEKAGTGGDDGPRKRGLLAAFFRMFDRNYAKLDHGYRDFLKWALKHKWLVFAAGNIILILSLGVMKYMNFEFMPAQDQGQFDVTIEMPIGTNVDETNRVASLVEERIMDKKKYPEVDSVFTTVGSGAQSVMGTSSTGPQYASIMVRMVDKDKRKRTVWQMMSDLGKDVADIPGPQIRMDAGGMGGSGRPPVQVEMTGLDTQQVLGVAERIEKVVRNTKGTRDVQMSWKVGKPEIQVTVDRVKAAQFGLPLAQIAMTLRNSIEGDTTSKYREKGDEYDIRIRLDESNRKSTSDVENIIMGGAMGNNILLKDVANVKLAEGPTKLDRKNRQRLITVEAQLAPGYAMGNVNTILKGKIAEIIRTKPEGVNVFFGGEAEEMRDAFTNMVSALLLAVVLVYMLMCALFESMLYPFIIMFALPQALIGALWALFLSNKSLSMVSMIGMIMLVGLVTKNAILLVDFTNTLRKRGMKRDEALIEAGPVRLRPILMTTLTVILGNLPIAMGLGKGSEFRSPMSVAVIGGLLVSTLLTLVVIPCTYSIVDDITKKFTKKKDDSFTAAAAMGGLENLDGGSTS
jgi:hydrophobic/amphiphilic exporter-1 (mainly G- bacteria), HAE1 family